MVTYSISKANANIGETITVSRSENVQQITYTYWVIDLQPSDYSSSLMPNPLNNDKSLTEKGKVFCSHSALSETVTIKDEHTITHTVTPITVSTPTTQYLNLMGRTPINELQGSSTITVDIGEPIRVNFNRNIYNQLKFLVNRWTKGKESISNKVTSISSSSTNTQYPSAKLVYDTIETKIDKLQKTVTTFNPTDYIISEDGANWDNDDNVTLPTNGNTIAFNFTDMLNDTGDYFEWELGVLHGTAYMIDDTHSDEIWNSSVNSMIRIRITKNQGSDSYHITTTDLSNNTIIKDYDKDYSFNLTFRSLNGVTVSFNNKKWYHTVSFIDMIYPIGSIYMSVNSINPSLFIGGSWEQIEDCFLLASGQTYQSGTTGGEATHTLTTNEMPSHTHTQNSHNHTQNAHSHGTNYNDYAFVVSENTTGASNKRVTAVSSGSVYVPTDSSARFHHYMNTNSQTPTINSQTATNQNTGGGQAHNNMPPYMSVYMWKRIA